MITQTTHTIINVLDTDSAHDFYTQKLGFEVRMDFKTEEYRWLTVSPKEQPEMELVLMQAGQGPLWTPEKAAMICELIQGGLMHPAVFKAVDCQKTYEAYRERGVAFVKEPTKEFYGIEAMFKDDSGNIFSIVQTEC